MELTLPPRIKTPKSEYTFDYPQAIEAANTQMSIFWLPDEIEVEKDLHDLKTNFTESEYHGVVTVLKLFTLYELVAGNEYWGNRVAKMFPRPDIQRMANCFSFFELNVHAPFYDKLNEVLGLKTDDFYNSYVNDPILKDRMDFIDSIVNDEDDLVSLGSFSMVEGAVLYSSFAYLKHFQSEGKNKLTHVGSGINFSVKDENLHSEGGAWLFRTLLSESNLSDKAKSELYEKLKLAANKVYEHECRIIDMIFEKGPIKGITAHQLKLFVQSRIDLCLRNLNISSIFNPTYNPIEKWFYRNINGGMFHDFFHRMGNEYNRNWKEKNFVWGQSVNV